MKRFFALLLGCLMLAGCAMAEIPEYTTLTSLDGFYGAWALCGGSDIPYLVLHADQTYEMYDYWQIDETAAGDDLIKRGAFTFDPAKGSLTLEGCDTVYTAQTCTVAAGETYTSGDGLFEAAEGAPLLLLYAPLADEDEFGDPSNLMMPIDSMPLLPTLEYLSDGHEWALSDAPAQPETDEGSLIFNEDGTVTLLADVEGSIVTTDAACTLDNGLLTIVMPDGHTYRLLLQYHYILNNPDEPSVGEDMLAYYNFEEAEDAGWSTAVSYELLLVHDLDDGTVCYLVRENG